MTCPPLIHGVSRVLENVPLARATYRLRFHCPRLAELIRPGQFLMLRVPGKTEPLLGRAFALYDTVLDSEAKPFAVDIVYLVVGKMTGLMASLKPSDEVEVWGPLGNGFPDYSDIEHLVLIAGGIGQTPFLALARRALGHRAYGLTAGPRPTAKREVQQVSLFYGARTSDLLAGLQDFEAVGVTLHLATDDGSLGFKGFVTQLLEVEHSALSTQRSALTRWVGCGPEPMLHALADLAQRHGVPCDLSLETPMACGVGICFSCVAKVKTTVGWDYRRVCIEGPVFDAANIIW